jgi:hypothetical protein
VLGLVRGRVGRVGLGLRTLMRFSFIDDNKGWMGGGGKMFLLFLEFWFGTCFPFPF